MAGASVNTAVRPVNTAGSKTTVNNSRPISNIFKKGYSQGNPQQKEYKEKGVIDSGCSRHMTGKKCYLSEYEDYDGGFVSFGDGKGRISGKVTIKTGLDFDNVYFCKELKYNFVINQFCEMKGIKREFSVARTPQQNGVAERRNRTLIEAARTMLVDSKLPTTFWAEAVNTVCYVLNRVLVIKHHNKTSYELIRRRTPLIDFMKPFRCHVTILNTREKQTNNTNSFNTAGTPVSASGPSFTYNDPSSPINAAKASNTFEDRLFERFSPFKNAFTLPDVPNVF
ncbi:ribonuclease H-like domain-containing protein [Tanacetum coccineum]